MIASRIACALSTVIFSACVIACAGGVKVSKPEAATEKPGERVEGLGKAANIDGMEVVIRRAFVEQVALDMGQNVQGLSRDPDLELMIAIRSTDPAKTFDYTTWTGTDRHVTDDAGNKYHHVLYTNGRPVGRTVYATVRSDAVVLDILVIQRPFPVAEHLDIDLPAPFDKSKVFRFRIKTADITRP